MNRKKVTLTAGISLAALIAAGPAMAGAFLLREQGAQATALSTAGAAADGAGLSSMFWNPATITDHAGWQSSWSVTGIFPSSTLSAQPGSTLLPFAAAGISPNSGDIGQSAALPASYTSYQLNDRIWLGLSLNTPFGLVTSAPDTWAGSTQGITSKVASYNATPTIAYKINDMISVAAGLQVQYFKTYLRAATGVPIPGPGFTDASVKGDGWGYGFTLGATIKPVEGTEIGIGYRSGIRQKVKGDINFSAGNPVPGSYPAGVTINLPDVVTVGLRQRLTPTFTMLAGFEWDHWSTLQNLSIYNPGGGVFPAGFVYENIPTRYKNGWLASLGGEYAWSPNLVLRAGLAYEKSPIDNSNRLSILPDSDRIWTSVGVGYRLSDRLSLDLSYAHLFGKDGTINYTSPGPVTLVANTKSHVDIVSVGLNWRWDAPPPPAPTLVRKY